MSQPHAYRVLRVSHWACTCGGQSVIEEHDPLGEYSMRCESCGALFNDDGEYVTDEDSGPVVPLAGGSERVI